MAASERKISVFVGAGRVLLLLLMTCALLLFSACAVVRAPQNVKIALFAPFEGRYREVGYNALYAARLALAESPEAGTQVVLLPVDDGGAQAANHAGALAQDPLVVAVIVLGYDATTPEALRAFGDIPVLVVGEWGAQPVTDTVFILSNPEISRQITAPPHISITDAAALPAPFVGSDVFALEGFAKLRDSLDGVTILSSGTLPDASFTVRYKGDDPFAPEPGLLAALTQQAMSYAILAAVEGHAVYTPAAFPGGYWAEAPVHRYVYENGSLTEDTVE